MDRPMAASRLELSLKASNLYRCFLSTCRSLARALEPQAIVARSVTRGYGATAFLRHVVYRRKGRLHQYTGQQGSKQ